MGHVGRVGSVVRDAVWQDRMQTDKFPSRAVGVSLVRLGASGYGRGHTGGGISASTSHEPLAVDAQLGNLLGIGAGGTGE